MNRVSSLTVVGLVVLFLMAVGLTVAAYYALVLPNHRGDAFYTAMVSSGIAELLLFAYLGYAMSGRSSGGSDAATRVRVSMLMPLWAFVILATAGGAAHPAIAPTFYGAQIILIQLAITFFFYAAIFFQHRQSFAAHAADAAPQQERRSLESYAGGLAPALADLRALAASAPDHLVAIDGLAKRVETVRTQLQATSAGTNDRDRPAAPADAALIEQRLTELHDEVGKLLSTPGESFAAQLQRARGAADRALAALRYREDAMTF